MQNLELSQITVNLKDDYNSDLVNKAFEKYAMPNYLGTTDRSDWDSLYPDRYADPNSRCFPIHSPEATAASAIVYSYLGGDTESRIGQRIKRSCELFELDALLEKIAQIDAPADPELYCLPSERKYPVSDAKQVKVAFDYLEQYHTKFSSNVRTEYANNLLTAHEQYGGLNNEQLHKTQWYAGLGMPMDVEEAFAPRKQAAYFSDNTTLYDALCKAEESVKQGSDCYRALDLLKNVDKVMQWKFTDPTDLLTGLTPQRAKEAASSLVVSKEGNVYNVRDLENIPDEVAVNWGTAAAVTLSKKIAMLREGDSGFEDAINHFGVKPVVRKVDRQKIDWESFLD